MTLLLTKETQVKTWDIASLTKIIKIENPSHDKKMGKCALPCTIVTIYISPVFLEGYLAVDQNVKGSICIVPTTAFPEICPKVISGKRHDTRILIITLFIQIKKWMHQ